MIHNPASLTYLKVDPEEYELLPYMDGSRTIEDLVVLYYELHEVLALARVVDLVELLRQHQFLTEPPLDAYAELEHRLAGLQARAAPARIAASMLHLSIPLPGFDGTVGRMYRAVGWIFFTRPVVIAGIASGLGAFLLFLYELGHSGYPLFKFGGSYLAGLGLLVVLDLLTISLHEVGHALAMKHAGRRVLRSGLMIYYGAPCAYVDTTDVWMAPRRERLIVSLAGPFTGVWIAAVCTIAVLLLPPGPLGAFFFSWAFVALFDNVLNFCPLLELDGYYLLVDLVEKPMLRARSLAFVRGPLWQRLRDHTQLTGEEWFFTAFGLGALAWSALQIFLVLRIWDLRAHTVVTEVWSTGQPLARALLIVVIALLVLPIALLIRTLVMSASLEIATAVRWTQQRTEGRLHHEAIAALKAVPAWAEVPEARLHDVARDMHHEAVAEGEVVVSQGAAGDRFYVVSTGALDVVVDGRVAGKLGPGDYFGERALLHDAPRAASVVASQASILFWVDRAHFQSRFAHDVAVRERLGAALAFREEVAAMPLFKRLGPSDLDLLLEHFEPYQLEAGAVLMKQGETGDRFYVVRSGELRVLKSGVELARLGPGDAVGEIALLLGTRRTATVEAVSATSLLALEAGDFRDLLTRYCHRATRLERMSHHRLVAHRRSNQHVSG